MARKMSRRLVALSTSAIAAAYVTGFVATQGANARLASGETAAAPASPSAGVTTASLTAPGAPATSTAIPSASASTSSGTNVTTAGGSLYRDGTYYGSGTSRRGGVEVTVVIKGGQIQSAAITGGTTQYPLSRIAMLPAQAVARQSAAVDRVTGATLSMRAYQQAVEQALAQASGGTSVAAGQASSVQAAPAAPAPGSSTVPAPSLPGQRQSERQRLERDSHESHDDDDEARDERRDGFRFRF